jgi:hypothetical protein
MCFALLMSPHFFASLRVNAKANRLQASCLPFFRQEACHTELVAHKLRLVAEFFYKRTLFPRERGSIEAVGNAYIIHHSGGSAQVTRPPRITTVF